MKELFTALSKFQSQVKNPHKSSTGVHNANYAPIESVWEVARGLLGDYGLSVSHFPISKDEAGRFYIGLRSYLFHNSGDHITNDFFIPCLNTDPQKVGAALTYLKRQSITGILGITPANEDLDADDIDTAATKKVHAALNKPIQNNSMQSKAPIQPSLIKATHSVTTGSPTISFGPHSGKSFDELSDKELSGAIEWARKNNKFTETVEHYDKYYKRKETPQKSLKKDTNYTIDEIPF